MKKLFSLVVAIIIMNALTSCQSCSRSGKKLATVQKQESTQTVVDSLQKVISGLISTDYDLQVKALKQLPEYEHAIFMTPLETREYMEIFSRLSTKYKIERDYDPYFEGGWSSFNDSLLVMIWGESRIKINYDTTQSLKPIASLNVKMGDVEKHKRTKVEERTSSNYYCDVYYMPKLDLCYAIVREGYTDPRYHTDIFMFDTEIRRLQ